MFSCLRFVEVRQQGLKSVLLPCATTLLLGSAWKSIWIVAILPDRTWSLLPSDLRRSYKHWVHLVLWWTAQNLLGGSEMLSLSQCRPEDSTAEVSKNNGAALFFDSSRSLMKSESSFCLTLMWFKRGYFREKFRISWSRLLPSALLVHRTIIRSCEIPSITWKPEPFLNF